MTRQEFIDRTGFTPTEEHFKEIHEDYMAAGEGVDKDAFCEGWLENNGAQRAYDWMFSRYDGARGALAAVKETSRELGNCVADLGDIIDRKDEEILGMKDRFGQMEVKVERLTERDACRAEVSLRYRKALLIAKLMLENLREEADGEDLTMTLDEIGSALALGAAGTNVNG